MWIGHEYSEAATHGLRGTCVNWPSRNRGPALPTALCGMTPVYCACVQQRSSINRLRIQNFAKPLQRSQDHILLPGGQRHKAIPEQIGSASWREREGQDVYILVVAV